MLLDVTHQDGLGYSGMCLTVGWNQIIEIISYEINKLHYDCQRETEPAVSGLPSIE